MNSGGRSEGDDDRLGGVQMMRSGYTDGEGGFNEHKLCRFGG